MVGKYRMTWFGILFAFLVYILAHTLDLELFEKVLAFLHSFETYELDEFIIPAFIILICLNLDFSRQKREDMIDKERVKIYRAMLMSTHHVLNNFLNKMQLFKLRASRVPDFDKEIVDLYDASMQEAKAQIEALSAIKQIDPDSIVGSVTSSQRNNISK